MTQLQIMELLKGLGATADDVADTLIKEGDCNGTPSRQDHCPIALYLKKKIPGNPLVCVDIEELPNYNITINITTSEIEFNMHAPILKKFISRFDARYYPDLILKPLMVPR